MTARAGKDILSSLVSGLLTIGPRFGGAIDGAARTWYESVKDNESPEDLIIRMKKRKSSSVNRTQSKEQVQS